MNSYGSLPSGNLNQSFYGSQSNINLPPNGNMTYNPSLGSLGNMNASRTRVNNRGVGQPVPPVGRVLTNSLLGSPNGSMVNNGVAHPQVMNQYIPQDLAQRTNINCYDIVREAYQRGYQDAQMAFQQGMGKKRRSTKKKTTTRKRSTSRK